MPKIKLTKTELKHQQDALKQFSRFLPTLQLKKQQLQVEIRQSSERLKKNEAELASLKKRLDDWIALFGDADSVVFFPETLKLVGVDTGTTNIAGVTVPTFDRANFTVAEYDRLRTDSWIDAALATLQELISFEEAHKILEEQHQLLQRELRATTQRVNLFEKVKIPETRNNIRSIRIYLGDQDTAGVARSKIAKRKTQENAA